MADQDLNINVRAPGAKQATQDLQDVARAEDQVGKSGAEGGEAAAEGADKASAGTERMAQSMGGAGQAASALNTLLGAAGLGLSLTAAVRLFQNLVAEMDRMNEAIAETGRLEAIRMRGAAERLTAEPVRAAARMTGWTASEVVQRAYQAQMQYGVEEADYYGLLSSIWPAPVPKEEMPQILDEAMLLWPAEAVGGEMASNLVLDIAAQPGGETTEGRRRKLGQATAAAGASRWESPEFTTAMLTAGPEMEAAGLGYEERLAWFGRASGALPIAPLRGTSALLQLARLGYAENSPKLQQLLQARGYRAQSGNMAEIFDAIVTYLEDAPTLEDREARQKELVTEMQIPKEVIGAMFLMSSEAAVAAEAQVREAVRTGVYGDIQTRGAETLAHPEHAVRAGMAARKLPELAMGMPGSVVEAQRLLDIGLGQVSNVTGAELEAYAEEWVVFKRETETRLGGGEAPKGDALEELFRLNKLYPQVRSALVAVAGIDVPLDKARWAAGIFDPWTVAGEAGILTWELDTAKEEANKWHWIGTQADKLGRYRNAIEKAVQFLRRVEENLGTPGTPEQQRAAESGLGAIVPPAEGLGAGGEAGPGAVSGAGGQGEAGGNYMGWGSLRRRMGVMINNHGGTVYVGQHTDPAGEIRATGLE